MAAADWNARLYDSSHAFVWQSARDLLGLLDPQPGEEILDVGCGTGHLTADVARSGARVLGIDSSEAMIAQARANFPELRFQTADANALQWNGKFDAVFSNAALHWINPPDGAVATMVRALKPGGRLVVEFGGHGNIVVVLAAAYHALSKLGVASPERLNPWYFPGIAEYSGLLESHGLEVTFAHLFDRPTPLEDAERGLANWFRMFGGSFLDALQESAHADFDRLIAEYAAPALFRNGRWTADYRRIRMAGRKPA